MFLQTKFLITLCLIMFTSCSDDSLRFLWGCGHNGFPCGSSDDCCENLVCGNGRCSGGWVEADVKPGCTHEKYFCTNESECCTGLVCLDGRCENPKCIPKGEICTDIKLPCCGENFCEFGICQFTD